MTIQPSAAGRFGRLARLWPRQIGSQCLLMLVLGVLLGRLLPAAAAWLQPLATFFLQASQIVVMPFLICELVVGFGSLSSASLRSLVRGGALVLLLTWGLGALVVILLPAFLPPLVYSGFFHRGLFEQPESQNLLEIYVPDNIFSGLAADNFPAVVLFSSLLGILLQGMDDRSQLLAPLEVMRRLFGRLNKLVARIIPFGILALTTINVARLEPGQLVRMQGWLQLSLIALLVLTLLQAGLVLALTPLGPGALWRIVRGPLALAASSGNLLICLPLLVESIRQELPACLPSRVGPAAVQEASQELAPLISLGFSLPTLGQIASLLFLPFAAWYVDQPMDPGGTVRMLATAIPASVSGLKATIRGELQRQGLPLDLLQLVYLNGEWLYRFEKVLSLEGLVLLALLVCCGSLGVLRLRQARLLATLVAAAGLMLGLGLASRQALALALRGSYSNDQTLMGLRSLAGTPPPAPLQDVRPAAVSLEAILGRDLLRVGVRDDGLPWAYRNGRGELVGYDVDLIDALARSLGVRWEVRQGSLDELERLLDSGVIDLAVGGIQTSPQRAIRHQLSQSYQPVHLALVVPDSKVPLLQNLAQRPLDRSLQIAVSDEQQITPDLRTQIVRHLVGPGANLPLQLVPIASKQVFFSPEGQRRFDGLLTTAEGGSAWAVLHPRTTLLALFHDDLASELVLLVGGSDPSLLAYLNTWLSREQARGRMEELFRHWVRIEN